MALANELCENTTRTVRIYQEMRSFVTLSERNKSKNIRQNKTFHSCRKDSSHRTVANLADPTLPALKSPNQSDHGATGRGTNVNEFSTVIAQWTPPPPDTSLLVAVVEGSVSSRCHGTCKECQSTDSSGGRVASPADPTVLGTVVQESVPSRCSGRATNVNNQTPVVAQLSPR